MKLIWLEKIIAQIQKNMHCPRCNNLIHKDFIEITDLCGSDFVKFSSKCQKCGTTAKISAEVEKKSSTPKIQKREKNEDKIKLLRNSLSSLNDQNLKKILKPSL